MYVVNAITTAYNLLQSTQDVVLRSLENNIYLIRTLFYTELEKFLGFDYEFRKMSGFRVRTRIFRFTIRNSRVPTRNLGFPIHDLESGIFSQVPNMETGDSEFPEIVPVNSESGPVSLNSAGNSNG